VKNKKTRNTGRIVLAANDHAAKIHLCSGH